MSEIKQNLTEFVGVHPKLKFLFFGGKGGVGKTVMAGVTAMQMAQQGRRQPSRMSSHYGWQMPMNRVITRRTGPCAYAKVV